MTGTATLWWNAPFRMFQTNIREIDAGMDVERVLDGIESYGADAWLLSCGGIVSNYPTGLAHQTRNPALAQRTSGDLIGDAVTAAARRGVRVLARMDFSKIDRPVAEAHPDWCYLAPDGTRQVHQGLTSVCPSGGYYQEKIFEVLGEILGRYRIDGFFFNWMGFNEVDYEKRYRGVCRCVACVAAFAGRLGGTLPTGPASPGYVEWQRLTHDTIDVLLARARDFIAARRPDAPLIMRDTADIMFHEANNALGRPLWPHRTSENVSVARSYRPHVPVLVNSVAFLDMPYRLVSEEPRQFEQYLLEASARGAYPSTYIMGTPDEFSYAALRTGSSVIRFHRDHHDVYTGLVPAARTAIVRADPFKADRPEHSTTEFQGLWTALLERHVPFDALLENRVAEMARNSSLDRYALLVLPDLGPLDDDVAAALDGFVERGGRLLLTGSTGLRDGRGQLAGAGVDTVLVSNTTRESTWSSAIVGDDGGSLLPILGEFHVVRTRPGAKTRMSVLSTAPYGPPEKCYGHLAVDRPPHIGFARGAGRTVTLPWTPGRAYREIGLGAVGDVVAEAARDLLGPGADVDTDLPAQVEVVLGRSGAGLVVHLRNLTGHRGQSFGDPVRIGAGHRLTLRVPGISSVRSLVDSGPLETTLDGDGHTTVALPALDVFEVLVAAT
ncbi:alpha-amylase family protein [Pseudonocardia nematodicida]|uniref:Alpha-amylase family protein n=1 Tax=Pseudonocardia nematodicida TaxID=1206997 RepID=A0ABV1KFI6_9PSEU